MRRRINIWRNIDWFTVMLYLLLVLMGWVNIYAAVYNDEHHSILDFSQRYGKQLIWIVAAIIIAITMLLIDVKVFSFFAYAIYGVAIFSLVAVLLFGTEINGAKSWFQIGAFRIQPAEFAKIATALALARYLSEFNVQLKNWRTYFRIGAILLLPPILVILQNDFGSALVYGSFILVLYREGLPEVVLLLLAFIVLLFILSLVLPKLIVILIILAIALIVFAYRSRNLKRTFWGLLILVALGAISYGANVFFELELALYYTALLAIGAASLVFILLSIRLKIPHVLLGLMFLIGSIAFSFSVDYVFANFLEPHQQTRINTLLGLESDPLGVEYNVNQSKIAIGSGGFSGKGFLKGTQTKYDFVPEQSTDFIFCTIGEEWGFVGSVVIIGFFLLLLVRLITLAERQRSKFSRIYGYGVVSVLFFHAMVNIGMTIGLMPVIGIPLPFFSYGGSSLWAFTILLFIMLRLDASRLEILH
ncbi:MAG: rod shape-determining protein RodA [Bacteroidales bacterium]